MDRIVCLTLLAFIVVTPAQAQRYVITPAVQEEPADRTRTVPVQSGPARWGEAFPTIVTPPSEPSPAAPAPKPTPQAQPTVATARPMAQPVATLREQADQYRLGPGDRVRAIVFGVEQLSGVFDVEDTGYVSFPLVGPILARGVSTTALELSYAEALRGRYVLDPKVSVQVDGYRPIYVLGEVGEPGSYPFVKGMTLMAAVATAKGFAPRANKRFALIRRAGSAEEVRVPVTPDALVRPGDTIRIPERFF